MKELVMTNESVNSYGYVTLTDGLDITQYQRNPILLFMHTRPVGGFGGTGPMPIGIMTNIRRDGDRLIGTPVFDEEDEFACKIKSKFDRGFIRMGSIGLSIEAIDEDPANWKPGQTRPTVTRSKLLEFSIVDIGANDDALAIDKDAELKVGDYVTLSFPATSDTLKSFKNPLNMKETSLNGLALVVATLGLAADTSEEQLVSELRHLKAKADMTDALMEESEKQKAQEIATLVNDAINDGRISKDNVETYNRIGDTLGVDSLKVVLAAYHTKEDAPTTVSLSSIISKSNEAERTSATWDELDRNGRLAELKRSNFEEFKRLFRDKFRKDYE